MLKRWLWVSLASIALCAPVALAQSGSRSDGGEKTTGTIGLRGGFSLEPDQLVVGGQVSLGQKLGIARIVPSVDVGFGSSVTTIAFNGDAQFRLNVEGSTFGLYLGAGPTLIYADPEGGNSSWKLGLTLLAGARMPFKRLPPTSFEARFGIGDVPDFKGVFVLEF